MDADESLARKGMEQSKEDKKTKFSLSRLFGRSSHAERHASFLEMAKSRRATTVRSSASLMGAYVNLEREARKKRVQDNAAQHEEVSYVIEMMS